MPKPAYNSRNRQVMPDLPWVDCRGLNLHLGLGETITTGLRAKLQSPVYWVQPNGRKVLYNLKLWQHYLLVGDGDEHKRLVESYLASLPRAVAV